MHWLFWSASEARCGRPVACSPAGAAAAGPGAAAGAGDALPDPRAAVAAGGGAGAACPPAGTAEPAALLSLEDRKHGHREDGCSFPAAAPGEPLL